MTRERARIERAVANSTFPPYLEKHIVAFTMRELAKERGRARRIVVVKREAYVSNAPFSKGYRRACDDFLAALRKGTR